ncbi:hypothetical protein ACLB2K_023154 [Fragaria x ananassa]
MRLGLGVKGGQRGGGSRKRGLGWGLGRVECGGGGVGGRAGSCRVVKKKKKGSWESETIFELGCSNPHCTQPRIPYPRVSVDAQSSAATHLSQVPPATPSLFHTAFFLNQVLTQHLYLSSRQLAVVSCPKINHCYAKFYIPVLSAH